MASEETSSGLPRIRAMYLLVLDDAKTAVRSVSTRGLRPASSSAAQLASSISRCCGSMSSASRGLIPNSSASKRSLSGIRPRTGT